MQASELFTLARDLAHLKVLSVYILLYRLLEERWRFKGTAPVDILRVDVDRVRFKRLIKKHRVEHEIDETIADAIGAALDRDAKIARTEGTLSLEARFAELSEQIGGAGRR